MSNIYRFVDTGTQDAALNMALDESILLHHLRGEVPPTLRIFRWSQIAISLGRFQDVQKEIVLEACQQQHVALVRRPTGGRAVYHRDEFTYSFISSKQAGIPSGIVAAYSYLAQGLIAALNDLGVQAELSQGQVSKNPSAACFASSTQADLNLTSSGFKLIGSAQVWKEDALLQQGSLPLLDHSAEFFVLLAFANESERANALRKYQEQTTPLLGLAPHLTRERIAQAFSTGFSNALELTLQPSELTASEWQLAQQLVEEKYSKLIWQTSKVKRIEEQPVQ